MEMELVMSLIELGVDSNYPVMFVLVVCEISL